MRISQEPSHALSRAAATRPTIRRHERYRAVVLLRFALCLTMGGANNWAGTAGSVPASGNTVPASGNCVASRACQASARACQTSGCAEIIGEPNPCDYCSDGWMSRCPACAEACASSACWTAEGVPPVNLSPDTERPAEKCRVDLAGLIGFEATNSSAAFDMSVLGAHYDILDHPHTRGMGLREDADDAEIAMMVGARSAHPRGSSADFDEMLTLSDDDYRRVTTELLQDGPLLLLDDARTEIVTDQAWVFACNNKYLVLINIGPRFAW